MSSFFTGVFAAETENPAELNKRSFAAHMLHKYPNGSFPLFGLLSQQGKSRAVSSTHGYFAKTMIFASIVVTGAETSGATTLETTSTSGIVVGMILYNPATRENMRVTAVTANTSVEVTRSFGRVAAAAIDASQTLICVGTAFMQGSSRPTSRGVTKVYVPNYTQIFRNAWALTDTARASAVEMGMSNIAENKDDCAKMHSTDCEYAIVFGQPEMDTSGTEPIHATQGIYDAVDQYAPANTNTAGATTTYDQFVELVDPAFTYSTDLGNPNARLAICGNTALKMMNKMGRLFGQINLSQKETSFGMKFSEFIFYRGQLNLVAHPLLNAHTDLAKLMIIIDPAALKLAYMEGRDTRPEEYGGTGHNNANGVDAQGGSLTTEFAVELINPSGCAVIENLTDAVA